MLAVVSAQGQVYEVRRVGVSASHRRRTGGGLRGKITSFSRASRRRLIDLALRLDTTNTRTTFLTLTFTGLPTWEEARASLKRFTMRLRRAYPEMSAIWRQEKQDRGAIHFHFILFNFPFVPQRELQRTWEECTRESRSIIHIKLLTSVRAVFNYVAKYVAKRDNGTISPSLDECAYQHDPTGRHWGYINKDALPLATKWVFHVADDDALRYAMWGCFALSNGRAGRSHTRAKLYCQDALDMLKFTLRICAMQGWRVIRGIQRRFFFRTANAMPKNCHYRFVYKPMTVDISRI